MRFVMIGIVIFMALLWLSYSPMPAGHARDVLEQVDRLQLDGL